MLHSIYIVRLALDPILIVRLLHDKLVYMGWINMHFYRTGQKLNWFSVSVCGTVVTGFILNDANIYGSKIKSCLELSQLKKINRRLLTFIKKSRWKDYLSKLDRVDFQFLPQNHGAGWHNSSLLGRFPIDFK